jgi:hypothetical protein
MAEVFIINEDQVPMLQILSTLEIKIRLHTVLRKIKKQPLLVLAPALIYTVQEHT